MPQKLSNRGAMVTFYFVLVDKRVAVLIDVTVPALQVKGVLTRHCNVIAALHRHVCGVIGRLIIVQ